MIGAVATWLSGTLKFFLNLYSRTSSKVLPALISKG